jgi:hypothetical protein
MNDRPIVSPISLINEVTFDQEFFRLLGSGNFNTQEDAFNYLNDLFRKATGTDRYSSYDSYRVCKNRRLKGHQGKTA